VDDCKARVGQFRRDIFQLSGAWVQGDKLWAPIEGKKYLSEIFEFVICQQTFQICP